MAIVSHFTLSTLVYFKFLKGLICLILGFQELNPNPPTYIVDENNEILNSY